MHRLIQPECPDCHAMLAEHERRCQNCGSTAIVDVGIHDIVRGERGSWLLAGILAVAAVLLVLFDQSCGTNMAASTWQFLTSRL
jgi:hypothetical protein